MMQLHYTGKNNLDVTPALKEYTEEKLSKLQHKFQNISNVYVVFHIERGDQIAEATVHIDGIELHASATTADMYQSIDALEHKLDAQLSKHKEKLIEDHR